MFLNGDILTGSDSCMWQHGEADSAKALALSRSWCFYGLLIEFFAVFELTVDIESFVGVDDLGDSFMTSDRLSTLLQEVGKGERQLDD